MHAFEELWGLVNIRQGHFYAYNPSLPVEGLGNLTCTNKSISFRPNRINIEKLEYRTSGRSKVFQR